VTPTTKRSARGRRPRKAAPVHRARRRPAPAIEARDAALETGRTLWLAGLGLAGSAYQAATRTFDALVARGRREEPRTRAAAQRVVRQVRTRANDLATDATRLSKRKLGQALDALGVDQSPRPKNLFHRLGDLTEALL
jgi:hypothetical protein